MQPIQEIGKLENSQNEYIFRVSSSILLLSFSFKQEAQRQAKKEKQEGEVTKSGKDLFEA